MNRVVLAVPVLFFGSPLAFAAPIQTTPVTVSFGQQGSFSDLVIAGAGINQTLTLPLFGSVLTSQGIIPGPDEQIVLNSILFEIAGQIDTGGVLTNNYDVAGEASVLVNTTSPWTVTSVLPEPNIAGNPMTLSETFAAAFTPVGFASSGIGAIPPGGQWVVPQMTLGPFDREYSYDSLNLTSGAWFDDGNFTANFSVDAFTGVNSSAPGGTGEFAQAVSTASWGQARVTYTYSLEPTGNPVPPTVALLAAGLGFLAVRQRRRIAPDGEPLRGQD